MKENKRYEIALSQIPGLNISIVRSLMELTGSVKSIFSDKHISKIPELKESVKENLLNKEYIEKADKEIEFCEKYKLKALFIDDLEYPKRLLECNDAPLILYSKGDIDYNAKKIVSIVGTRKATIHGEELTEKIVHDLAQFIPNLIVVSGLAFGIDICAHKSAIKYDLKTAAVLAHGFKEIYPPLHRNYAIDIIEHGCLITEFMSGTPSLQYQFLKRNRIIAGLSDACIVIESAKQGGSMKTAANALSYNREVFACPGRPTDIWSSGCNDLIKDNRAILAESAEDIIKGMNWDITSYSKDKNQRLFPNITDNQQKVYDSLPSGEQRSISEIVYESNLSISEVLSDLMQMEMLDLVRSMPGGYYLKKS